MVGDTAFPDGDEFMASELAKTGLYQEDHLRRALLHVTDWSLAVDGGAHVGTWTRTLAEHFRRVIAFEPSHETFAALWQNVEQWNLHDRVVVLQAALGAAPGYVSMGLDDDQAARKNLGARYVVDAGGGVTTPRVMLDNYDLKALGFLKLDVEGSEYDALAGARDTLARCRPIVLYEEKGFGARYGHDKKAVPRLMAAAGYTLRERVGCDEIWGSR